MIRLLAFDLDGTTITEHKYLSTGNRQALIRAFQAGVTLLPATGRMLRFLPEEIVSLPGVEYAITSNGAAVYELQTGRPVFQRLIPNQKALEVQALLNDYDVFVEYYRDGGAITKTGFPERAFSHFGLPESKRHFVEGKTYTLIDNFTQMLETTGLCPEKINLPYLEKTVRAELWKKLNALGGLRLTSSLAGNIEINDADAHKGAALLAMAVQWGVPPTEIMAVGDNGNDVTMLQAAGCSVAVEDGTPEALAAADCITAAHTKDGLALAIQACIFGEADLKKRKI